MIILLFGVSNIGKSVTGKLLAEKLGYDFYDVDEEVKKSLHVSLEQFVSNGTLYERDQIRCLIINGLIQDTNDKVIAVTPFSYMDGFKNLFFHSPNVFSIELLESASNIFNRLVFSDENDVIYKDDKYKNKHKKHYISEIQAGQKWYGSVYSEIEHKFKMGGKQPDEVVASLISEFGLGGV